MLQRIIHAMVEALIVDVPEKKKRRFRRELKKLLVEMTKAAAEGAARGRR